MLQILSKVPAKGVKQQLEGVLNQSSEGFKEGIGTLKHTKARVMIHENAQKLVLLFLHWVLPSILKNHFEHFVLAFLLPSKQLVCLICINSRPVWSDHYSIRIQIWLVRGTAIWFSDLDHSPELIWPNQIWKTWCWFSRIQWFGHRL